MKVLLEGDNQEVLCPSPVNQKSSLTNRSFLMSTMSFTPPGSLLICDNSWICAGSRACRSLSSAFKMAGSPFSWWRYVKWLGSIASFLTYITLLYKLIASKESHAWQLMIGGFWSWAWEFYPSFGHKFAIKFEELENSRRTVKDQIISSLWIVESCPIHPPTIICIINTHFITFYIIQ